MKKLLVTLIVMAMLLGGCCALTQPDGTTTKSFTNCFARGQDVVCNASPEVLAVAQTVIDLLAPIVNSYVPGSAIVTAYLTAQNIKTYGCATLTSLNNLIAFIQGYNTKALTSGTKAPAKVIPVEPLIEWGKK